MYVILWLMYGVIVVHSINDYYQTHALITLGFSEGNPIMAWIINHFGIEAMLYFKIYLLIMLGLLLAWYTFFKNKVNE